MFVVRDNLADDLVYNDMFTEMGFIKHLTTNNKIVEKEIKKFLKENNHTEFIKFGTDIVYIYIYKLRNNYIEQQ